VIGNALYMKRRLANALVLSVSVLITIGTLFFLLWILKSTVEKGISNLTWKIFVDNTPAPGSPGGLANALAGSGVMILVGILIGAPVGILAGTFLGEYGKGNRMAGTLRFLNDVLLSAPSIVTGLFVYSIVVVPLGHFSGLAGGISLALVALPIIVRTTDEMLQLVPSSLKEAAFALGAPRWKVIVSIGYRSAAPGLLTGVLLAVARISGETAPLLFTALNNQFWSMNVLKPMANIPVAIFQFAMSPYRGWQSLAWTGALIAVAVVFCLNLVSRVILHRLRKQ
jgi:phosphate transport system permease protein